MNLAELNRVLRGGLPPDSPPLWTPQRVHENWHNRPVSLPSLPLVQRGDVPLQPLTLVSSQASKIVRQIVVELAVRVSPLDLRIVSSAPLFATLRAAQHMTYAPKTEPGVGHLIAFHTVVESELRRRRELLRGEHFAAHRDTAEDPLPFLLVIADLNSYPFDDRELVLSQAVSGAPLGVYMVLIYDYYRSGDVSGVEMMLVSEDLGSPQPWIVRDPSRNRGEYLVPLPIIAEDAMWAAVYAAHRENVAK